MQTLNEQRQFCIKTLMTNILVTGLSKLNESIQGKLNWAFEYNLVLEVNSIRNFQ